ncbi:MAG: hypothetical protein PF440_08790 [Thiomicrorhabdus sp.]|jgi:hypothetical protein|nr:hypothetical protein [Thiomicrorhabdus sp.]
MNNVAKQALSIAKKIQNEAPIRYVPPSEGTVPMNQTILPHSMVRNTRGYIEKVVYQINGAYEKGWFDACAVMMRRLLETLIVEVFEEFKIANKIQNSTGDFLYLADLISATLREPSWNLGRNTKRALPKLKSIGDQSAHSRRFNAHREDIDKLLPDFRTAAQELLYLAKLK